MEITITVFQIIGMEVITVGFQIGDIEGKGENIQSLVKFPFVDFSYNSLISLSQAPGIYVPTLK